jgi:hypothetical protein
MCPFGTIRPERVKSTISTRNSRTQKLKKKKERDVENKKQYNNRKTFYSNSIL